MQEEFHYRPHYYKPISDYRKLQLALWLVFCDSAEREAFSYSLRITSSSGRNPSWCPVGGVTKSSKDTVSPDIEDITRYRQAYFIFTFTRMPSHVTVKLWCFCDVLLQWRHAKIYDAIVHILIFRLQKYILKSFDAPTRDNPLTISVQNPYSISQTV